MAISGDIFRINQVYELLQEGQWPLEFYAAAPEPESNSLNYGWFGGGGPSISTVDRINFASDTGTASARGPLSLARGSLAATGNDNYGWFGGGATSFFFSTVDRINFASDTGTASVRGPLTTVKYTLSATGNDNYGWFGGGNAPSTSSFVDRIDYADDTATASVRGH